MRRSHVKAKDQTAFKQQQSVYNHMRRMKNKISASLVASDHLAPQDEAVLNSINSDLDCVLHNEPKATSRSTSVKPKYGINNPRSGQASKD